MTMTPFTVRSPVDVFALVAYGFGFHPTESLVLVALTEGGASFQARVDLPRDPADVTGAVAPLVVAATRNRAQAAFVIAYTADPDRAHISTDALDRALSQARITVLAVHQVAEPGFLDLADPTSGWQSFDLAAHPLLLQAAYDGRAPLRSRTALAETLRPVTQAAQDQACRIADAVRRHAAPGAGRDPEQEVAREGAWVLRAVRRAIAGRALGESDTARLLVAITHEQIRERVGSEIERASARAHVELWIDLVRQAPDDLLGAPGGLLAFAAWMAGDGSLAWCAIDRCREAAAPSALAEMVAVALEAAIGPAEWSRVAGLTAVADASRSDGRRSSDPPSRDV